MPKLHLADLDKSYTNPLENSSGFVLDLSKTCPLVASADTDLSVSDICLRHVLDKSARWSLGINKYKQTTRVNRVPLRLDIFERRFRKT